MKSYLQLLTSLCLLFFVLPVGALSETATPAGNNTTNNVTIIKQLPSEQELNVFIAGLDHTEYFTNTATLTATKQHPTWPHDKWSDPDGNRYVSFYYKDNSSSTGYISVYYDDCGRELKSVCRISFKLIEPYYGLSVTENQTVLPIANETVNPVNNTTAENYTVLSDAVGNVSAPLVVKPGIKNTANNNTLKIDNLGNNGTIVQQNAGGSIWNSIVIYAQNFYLTATGK